MIVSNFGGAFTTKPAHLTTTDPVTLYTVPGKSVASLESFWAANTTGTAATITLSISDGTETWDLISAREVEGSNYLREKSMGLSLPEGWSIIATGGTANALDVTVSVITGSKTKPG